jgi:hypothetical protein
MTTQTATPTAAPVHAGQAMNQHIAELAAAGQRAYANREYTRARPDPRTPPAPPVTKYAIDVRAGSRGGRKFGIWQNVWLKPVGADGTVAKYARRKEWMFVGEVNAEYTGPASNYAKVMAQAEQLLAQVNAMAGGEAA